MIYPEYFGWTKQIVDPLRGLHEKLEKMFDVVCANNR